VYLCKMLKKTVYIIFFILQTCVLWSQRFEELNLETQKFIYSDSDKALHFARLSLSQAQTEFGINSPQYAGTLNSIGEIYKNKNQLVEAEKYLLKARAFFSDSIDTNCEEYGVNLMSLGRFYHQTFQYEKAYFWFNQFIEFSGKTSSDCKGAYAYVGDFYSKMGDYKRAQIYLEKNVNDCDFLAQKVPVEYAYRIERLADFYVQTGNYLAADQLFQKCLPIFQKYLPAEHPEWTMIYSKYLSFLIALKNYKKADWVIKELFKIPYTKSSVEAMHSIANAYWQMGNKQDAETFFQYSISLSEKQSPDGKCSDTRLYAQMGAMYVAMKNFSRADDYLQTAEKIIEKEDIPAKIKEKKANEDEKERYINVLTNLGILQNAQKNHEKAIVYFKKAWSVLNSSNAVNDERGREILSQLIVAYDAMDNYKDLQKIIDLDVHGVFERQISRVLPVVGTRLRSEYLEKNERFNHILSSILTRSFKNIEKSGELIYDYCLQTKGIALQWNLGDLAQSRRSNDSSVIILYKKWQNLKNQLLTETNKNRETNAQLEEVENQLSQKLYLSKSYFKNGDWRNVQQNLEQNELAIEFLSTPYYSTEQEKYTGDTLYFATILGYNSNSPEVVYLFEQKELKSLLDNGDDFYFDHNTYEKVWSKITPFTNNITKIKYSAAGLLHNVVFSAIKEPSGKQLIDFFQFNKLMSTRNIAFEKKEIVDKKEALIFAGMDYNEYSDEVNYSASHVNLKQDSVIYQDRTRGNFSYYYELPYTKKEGEKIHMLNDQNNITSRFFSGKYASEKNIKGYTFRKKSPNSLIISTHGFYNQRDTSSSNPFSWNSDPLVRCGLVMAGANRFSGNNKIFGDANEGIWTGYEIEQSNLSNTELVILSACESGNGEISNSEGVFGLQRAFKLAGAEYLLLCFNKIHDQSASEFVTIFYEKYIKGDSIEKAFYETQLQIKNKYPNDLDWANWVLIK
jgi:CHAT domain-containing protein